MSYRGTVIVWKFAKEVKFKFMSKWWTSLLFAYSWIFIQNIVQSARNISKHIKHCIKYLEIKVLVESL